MNNRFDLQFVENTTAGKVKPDYVAKTEKMIGLKFPTNFLSLLEARNGGVPVKRLFKIDDEVKVLERFLCLVSDYKVNKFGDFDIGVVWSRIEDRLDGNLLPFAAVFAGDYLCFDYADNRNKPKVVLWYHELSDEEAPYIIPVADSFDEFLEMLYEDPEKSKENNYH